MRKANLQAAMEFMAREKNSVVFALNGVRVQTSKENGVTLTATDGRIAILITDRTDKKSNHGIDAVIDGDACKRILKGASVKSPNVWLHATGKAETAKHDVPFDTNAPRYPEWASVASCHKTNGKPNNFLGFNPEYLKRAARAFELLQEDAYRIDRISKESNGNTYPVRMTLGDKGAAAMLSFETDHVTAIAFLMPVLLEKTSA